MTNIKRYSLDEIKAMKARGEVSSPAPDAEEIDLPDDFWDKAEVVDRRNKQSVHLRVDAEVLDYFKDEGRGKGHITRMQAVLRSYVEAQKNRHTPS